VSRLADGNIEGNSKAPMPDQTRNRGNHEFLLAPNGRMPQLFANDVATNNYLNCQSSNSRENNAKQICNSNQIGEFMAFLCCEILPLLQSGNLDKVIEHI
jgi:hypothetical protein